jgi:hypothetical protein
MKAANVAPAPVRSLAVLQEELRMARGAEREKRLDELCHLTHPPLPACLEACTDLLREFPRSRFAPAARAEVEASRP